MTKTGYVLITLIFLILIRIPALSLWNNYMTGNDAAIYLEKAIHLSEGKGFTSSICRFMADRDELREYIAKYGNKTQEIKVAPLYIFIISGIYSITGENNYLLAINILNLLLFIALLLVIFYWIVPLFTDNYKIGLLTVLMVGLNYTYFEGMFGAHLETLSLLLFVCTFAWHCKLIGKKEIKLLEITGYSVLLSLLFLSKYSSLPFVAAFILHNLIQRKYYRFLAVAFLVAILAGSWFILRDILLQGRVMADFTQSLYVNNENSILSIAGLKSFTAKMFGVIRRLIQVLFEINGLAFLFPFAVVYYSGQRHGHVKQINWLMLILSVLFFASYGFVDLRYIYPILIPLIPASLLILSQLLENYRPFVKKAVFLVLFLIFAGYQLSEIVFYTNAVRKQAPDREAIFQAADGLLQSTGVDDQAIVLTNILGYNVYSDVGIVKMPSGLNKDNKKDMFGLYDIDYVLFCYDQLNTQLAWDQYDVTDDVFTDLALVAVSRADSRVRLYSVRETIPLDKEP